MSNHIVKFDFQGHGVRVIRRDDREEWIAKDVCDVLEIQQATRAVEGLDKDEVSTTHIVDSAGKKQEVLTVTEPGLYRLIMRSRKPAARAFARWVTHEVLPAIRRDGGYVAPGHEEQFAQILAALTCEVKALREWKDSKEREHPFGLMGPRDAKVLAGQVREIRDMMIKAGDERKPRALLLIVDRSIRFQAGYPKDKGAKWENATAAQATIAFSRASQWIAALRKDIADRARVILPEANQARLFQ